MQAISFFNKVLIGRKVAVNFCFAGSFGENYFGEPAFFEVKFSLADYCCILTETGVI